MTSQLAWFIGLIASVAGALVGQAELIGEPYRHYVTIAFVVCTAISGYMLQKPREKWTDSEREKWLNTNGDKK